MKKYDVLDTFDFSPATRVFKTMLDFFDFNKPIAKQSKIALCEDMLSVGYLNQIWLWLDWRPSGDLENGCFIICVKTTEYEDGFFYWKETRLKRKMIEFVLEAHEIAKNISERRGNDTLDIKKESIDSFLKSYRKLPEKKRKRIRILDY